MTKEIRKAVEGIKGEASLVVERAIVDALYSDDYIKLNAFVCAREYAWYKAEYKEGNKLADEDEELTLEEFLDYAVLNGIVIYKDDNGEIRADWDTNRFVGKPLKDFIKEESYLFESYNDPDFKTIYKEMLGIYGE